MRAYLDEGAASPYCRGCGHPHVLEALDEALQRVGRARERIVLVSDIGCVGLADARFPTLHTVHALHGRAAALATGLQQATARAPEGGLAPVVLVGDGGATIGLLHLVHAAQLDADMTVVVHDNLVYGMTGGQHSAFTPEGLSTTTTPGGCPLPPLDLARILEGAGCGWFARARAPGPELVDRLEQALRRPGFACVEVFELCPTFAARVGGLTGRSLDALLAARGRAPGLVLERPPRPRPAPAVPAPVEADAVLAAAPSGARPAAPVQLVLAGRAGERVQSAARLVAAAGLAAGLGVALRTDNPVTQGRGFSLAELTLAPGPVHFAGSRRADVAVVTAPEGLAELAARGSLAAPRAPRRLLLDASLERPAGCAAEALDLRKRFGPTGCALGGALLAVRAAGWLDEPAVAAALASLAPARRVEAARVLAALGDAASAAPA